MAKFYRVKMETRDPSKTAMWVLNDDMTPKTFPDLAPAEKEAELLRQTTNNVEVFIQEFVIETGHRGRI